MGTTVVRGGSLRRLGRQPGSLAFTLFGQTRQQVLGLFFSRPNDTYYLREVARRSGHGLVIGSDQVAHCEGRLLGKPGGHADGSALVVPGEAYFLHSYHFVAESGRDIAAMTDHGGGLVAAVARDNLVGVQFHPEKSQAYGLALLSRFLEWNP